MKESHLAKLEFDNEDLIVLISDSNTASRYVDVCQQL